MNGILQRRERKLSLKSLFWSSHHFFFGNSLFVFKFKLPELEKLEIQAVLPIYGEFSIVMSQMRRETSVLLPTPSTSKDQLAGWYSDTAVSWVNTLMNLVFSNFDPHHHTC